MDNKRLKLASSELIINNRGAIYHLDLKPDEIAETVITVGDPSRVKKVSQYFDSVDIKRKHREFKTHTGWLAGKRISVISTGIGTDNIDIVINEIDALFNINFKTRKLKKKPKSVKFIRIGTSGSLQENIPINSFVINTGAIGLEGLGFFYGAKRHSKSESGIPYYYASADTDLVKVVGQGMIKGVALTANGFYAPQGRSLRHVSNFSKDIENLRQQQFNGHAVSNMEMETSGIYFLANLLGHQAVSCNAILANRVVGDFSEEPGELVDRLIRKVIQEIRMLNSN